MLTVENNKSLGGGGREDIMQGDMIAMMHGCSKLYCVMGYSPMNPSGAEL